MFFTPLEIIYFGNVETTFLNGDFEELIFIDQSK